MGYPIRVLHTVVNMNRGGAETFIMNLYRNIDRDKIQFDFLTSKEGVFDDEIKSLGGKVYRTPSITSVGPFAYAKNLREFFKTHSEYRIVHSHMDKMSGLVLREAKKAGLSIRIAHSHNTRSEGNVIERMIKSYYGRGIAKSATDNFACSRDAANWLFKNGRKAIVVNNGIDVKEFAFSEELRALTQAELCITRQQKVLIHVGRFAKQKNQLFILKVFAELVKTEEDCILLLVGDGPLFGEAQKLTEKLQIQDKVKFLGIRKNISALMAVSDLLIFPSLFEGLSVVLIEAQVNGIQCLVSDRITKDSIIREDLVDILPLGDKYIWAEKISEIMDSELLEKCEKRNSYCDPNFDIRNVAVDMELVYLEKWKDTIDRN